MNTLELIEALSLVPKKVKTVDVYASDEIPIKIELPAAIISNTQPSYMRGLHWTALFVDKSGSAYFFDSYGRLPDTTYMRNAIKRNCRSYRFSRKRLQSLDS